MYMVSTYLNELKFATDFFVFMYMTVQTGMKSLSVFKAA